MNRKCVVVSRPDGAVQESNFAFRDDPAPEVAAKNGVLVKALYMVVNPPLRMRLTTGGLTGQPVPIGGVMRASGLGRVVASTHANYAEGDLVTGELGWQEYAAFSSDGALPLKKVQKPDGLPLSTLMGVMGSSGATAYFGVQELCKPQPGETLLVSAAAGSVGALVVQLGKLAGCRVVGIAGHDAKCRWLVDEVGVDAAINYRTEDVAARVKETCPDGVHMYFDNVGGETLDIALANIAIGARVVLCGATSQYQHDEEWYGPKNYFQLVYKRSTMVGFYIADYAARTGEANAYLSGLIREGKLKYNEDVLVGFDELPKSLIRVLAGDNFGTQVVRLTNEA